MTELTAVESQLVEDLMNLFASRVTKLEGLLYQVKSVIEPELNEGGRFYELIHSTKGRIKDETHLREKLRRKIAEGKESGTPYDVSTDNFFYKVTDLAAYRIMHLHPKQMAVIHPALLDLFKERKLDLYERPAARVWDLETKKFYREVVGIDTVDTEDKLYSSVHYVVLSNWETKYTCEIQVRTLADEVWGEVDHTLNYPSKSPSIACREQIKSLAHITTSCNRLVDSIFESRDEWKSLDKTKT
jgi:ppGpp synthetase/RelA/SpoT-type nucleotidyltranferase